jgi:hypothetical protein
MFYCIAMFAAQVLGGAAYPCLLHAVLDWIGLDWIGLDWIGLDGIAMLVVHVLEGVTYSHCLIFQHL